MARGYFPAELPPVFTTKKYAEEVDDLASKWDLSKIEKFWTAPERFSIPRYGQARRSLSIVNPINQLLVASLISSNWLAIKEHLSKSKITEFRPIITHAGGRSVSGVDFDSVSRRKVELLATFGRYLKTDVLRFYPSIYTHSIAWALKGKQWVKENYKSTEFKESYANKLDAAIRACQLGQSVGIPIGPDTSRIISEAVATAIEEAIRIQIPDLDRRAVRYVDDMIIGFGEGEAQEAILSRISAALYDYELEINAEKTQAAGIGFAHTPEWIHFIRNFALSAGSNRQRDDIDSFFEQCLHLSDENVRENVLLYACKRAATFSVDDRNWLHLIRWLMYCARRSGTCLDFLCEFLSSAAKDKKELPLHELSDFVHALLPYKADAAHQFEVAWLLFLARELKIKVNAEVLKSVLHLRSGVVALLVLDMRRLGLINGEADFSFWRGFATSKGLETEMWLAAYEVTRKEWWPNKLKMKYITDHSWFSELHSRGVYFYDEGRGARPTSGKAYFQMIRRFSAQVAAETGY